MATARKSGSSGDTAVDGLFLLKKKKNQRLKSARGRERVF